MIVYIAPSPVKQKNIDGYYNRVLAIEKQLPGTYRYLTDIDDAQDMVNLLKKADVIYVHSIYMLQDYFFFIKPFADKVIVDLHGAVSDEETMMGHGAVSKQLAIIERMAFSTFNKFVVVSDAMTKHYKQKYSVSTKIKFVRLPIFNSIKAKVNYADKDMQLVVYSGGLQKWQNVDQMLEMVNSSKGLQFIFMTQDPEAIRVKIKKEMLKNVSIRGLAPENVFQNYKKPTYGLILRDDTVINMVACPTKLIEYMQHGIIPVVKSEKIGDFYDLGYRYVTSEQLLTTKITDKQVQNMMKQNEEVVHKLELITQNGIAELKDMIINIKRTYKKQVNNEQDYTDLLIEYQRIKKDLQNILEDRDRVVAHLRRIET